MSLLLTSHRRWAYTMCVEGESRLIMVGSFGWADESNMTCYHVASDCIVWSISLFLCLTGTVVELIDLNVEHRSTYHVDVESCSVEDDTI